MCIALLNGVTKTVFRPRQWPAVLLTLALFALADSTGSIVVAGEVFPPCAGDCDGDGRVSTAELVRAVAIALGDVGFGRCESLDINTDQRVTVDEVVQAVEEALEGCPGRTPFPTRTPSLVAPTLTPTATGTATTTGPVCGDGVAEDPEECDDGNTVSGDGCDAGCQLEPGGNPCAGVPTSPGTAPRAVLVADGLNSPLFVTAPPLDPRRVFIVERPGKVLVLENGVLLPQAFLDVSARVWQADRFTSERGLLGLAFHPDFESNGRFFVYYTNLSGNNVIARYDVTADPNDADEDSEKILLTLNHPTYANHNGGQLAFGPDGFLYVGTGDGGGAGDPFANGQSETTLLGKLLRLDVNVDDPPYYRTPPTNPHTDATPPFDLIWARGLRNPWRFSFDRQTRELYIGDVGQDDWEEIDVQPADSAGGENYGWRVFEGDHCFNPAPLPACPDPATGFTFPVLEYDHSNGNCSITGGFVYRGCALPDLRGTYFFADYCSAFIRGFRYTNGTLADERDWTADLAPLSGGPIDHISSFGEDARGELYVCDLGDGKVFKLEP